MSELIKELFRVRLYKRSQGRFVRGLTMLALFALFASGAALFGYKGFAGWPNDAVVRWTAAGIMLLTGTWFAFRLIHYPTFADFLISVEAEMVKVSWPSNAEVYSSTMVVLAMFLILSALIFVFDLVWVWFFRIIGIIVT